jgi:hypothetical protein
VDLGASGSESGVNSLKLAGYTFGLLVFPTFGLFLLYLHKSFLMLQRIQTIWLLLASIALFCLFLSPYLQILNADGVAKEIRTTGVYENINGQTVQSEPFTLITITTVMIALLPFAIIFFYKNRKQQMMMCYITVVIIIAHYFWLVQTARQVIGDVQLQIGNFGIGAMLPSFAILFIMLAIRGIRRDEQLIKSADRLR